MDEKKLQIKFDIAKHKAELAESEQYQEIRQIMLNKIIGLAKSEVNPIELKGMLKVLGSVDDWIKEFENIKNERR